MTAMPPHRGAAAKPRPYAARSGPPPFPSGLSAPPAACASCSGRRCPPPSHQGQRTSCAVPPRLDITRPVPRQAEQGTGAGGSSSPVEAMRRRAYRRRVLGVRPVPALALLVALLATAATTAGRPVRGAPRCPVFPRDNAWNRRVDRLPVASDSSRIIAAIGAERPVHADFGSGRYDGGPIGIPYTTVAKGQRRVPIRFQYADESDRGPYPIPRNAPVEGGRAGDGDRHVIVVDRGRCRLYELFDAHPVDGGASWRAGSGAIWSLRSNDLRPRGWTSADAAGLPILPGLARYEELARGGIDHALRFTVPRTPRGARGGGDRPRPALHGPPPAQGVHRAGTALRLRRHGPVAAADGAAGPPQGVVLDSRLRPPGAGRPRRAQALRDAARGQRLALVHLRRALVRLEQRRPPPTRPGGRPRLRGR